MSEPDVSLEAIERVLASEAHYDDLNSREQAIVRAEWAERTEQRRRSLSLTVTFAAEGRPYVELDDDGKTVRRQQQRSPRNFSAN
ncbi:hypothetical protein [Candidatus Poriferisodalis sp.]|uniref:hypothetical protein n=1 Tax=Candidatus Poriferisodalis sp. TaxID=3101277 RepID=UPI003B515887